MPTVSYSDKRVWLYSAKKQLNECHVFSRPSIYFRDFSHLEHPSNCSAKHERREGHKRIPTSLSHPGTGEMECCEATQVPFLPSGRDLRKAASVVAAIVAVPHAVVDLSSSVGCGALLACLLRKTARYRKQTNQQTCVGEQSFFF